MKKKKVNPEDFYISKISDDHILEYAIHEIRNQLPQAEYPMRLILGKESEEDIKKHKNGVYYASFGAVTREDQYANLEVKITYADPITKEHRYLTGGSIHVDLQFSDYDCVNTLAQNRPTKANETWVDRMDEILKDPEYRAKAEAYAKEKYPPLGKRVYRGVYMGKPVEYEFEPKAESGFFI